MGEMRNSYKILIGRPEEERSLWRPNVNGGIRVK
jgi:hypothetical protein